MPRKRNTRKRATKSPVNTDTARRSPPFSAGSKVESGKRMGRRFRPDMRPPKMPGRLGGR